MSLKERMSENPKPFIIGAVVVIVLAMAWVGYSMFGGRTDPTTARVTQCFFSDDDGESYFADAYEKLATTFNGPHGKEAVRAHVAQFPGDKPFVVYLEKYTPKGKAVLARFYSDPVNKGRSPREMPELVGQSLVKKPGAANWTSTASPSDVVAKAMGTPLKNGEPPMFVAPE